MLPAFALAALTATGHVRYWHVAVLAGVIGMVNALDMPSRQTFVVEMVAGTTWPTRWRSTPRPSTRPG